MTSRIYSARVMHTRGWPVKHRFSYPVYVYGFDVDDLPHLDRVLPLFGHNRFRLASIHDRDYLHPGPGPLREKVMHCLETHGVEAPVDRIFMITAARYCGYVFNPVSFFCCYTPAGELAAFIAYVNNTFGESHLYVMADAQPPIRGFDHHFQAVKQFHVSPFFDLHGRYDFHLVDPGERLDVMIQLSKDDGLVFTARLQGVGRLLTTGSMVRTIGRYPLTAALTVPRIVWQAGRLYYQRKLPIHHKPVPASPDTIRFVPPRFSRRLAMSGVLDLFERFEDGALAVTFPDRSIRVYGEAKAAPDVHLTVRNYDFFWRLATAADTGLGESYMAGDWHADDLAGFLKFLVRNWDVIRARRRSVSLPLRCLDFAFHLAKANTLTGSRRNIRAHYDLGNAFFEQFLDESMTYSCGLYRCPDDTLATAQRNKIAAIIRKAGIGPGDHVLEVGCGWGSFAIAAARQTGCRVTGITVSEAQFQYATQRVREAGLADRVEIRLCDYRAIQGQFDRIVSIEMLEAVGHANLGTYFGALGRALKTGGRAVIQVITIPDQRYGRYGRNVDFIKKHVFPGGHLPSLGAMAAAAGAGSTLTIEHVEDIGEHYVHTLKAWCERFRAARDRIRKQGFDDAFVRKWEYYFCYCEAGFDTGLLQDLQIVLRPTVR